MISKHQLNTCAINFVKILTSAVVEETKALDTVDRIELLLHKKPREEFAPFLCTGQKPNVSVICKKITEAAM